MEETLSYAQIKEILQRIADRIMQEKDNLTNLDSACGDGDLGVGMYLGFRKAKETLDTVKGNDIGDLLNAFGSAILASAGGASGPLFGSLFIQAGELVHGKDKITLEDTAEMFNASLNRICALGGTKVGDKTLVDALEPAVKTLKEAVAGGLNLKLALQKAADAARQGTETTRNLIARRGKAKYLKENSIGYIDPGAKVVELIFEAFLGFLETT